MIALVWWQAILNFLGAVLAYFYKVIPNYGVAIILLTLAMRVVLLPLGIKQIRSMNAKSNGSLSRSRTKVAGGAGRLAKRGFSIKLISVIPTTIGAP